MMERAKRSVDTALLMEQYRALLETVDVLPLEVSGSSMTPFLAPGRAGVLLVGFFCPRLDQRRAAAAGAARALRQDIREEKTMKASKDFILRREYSHRSARLLLEENAERVLRNETIEMDEPDWFD